MALLGAPSTTHPRRCWQAQSLSPPSASKCKLSYCYVHRFFVFCICLAVFFLEGPSTVPNLVALLHIDARTALKKKCRTTAAAMPVALLLLEHALWRFGDATMAVHSRRSHMGTHHAPCPTLPFCAINHPNMGTINTRNLNSTPPLRCWVVRLGAWWVKVVVGEGGGG